MAVVVKEDDLTLIRSNGKILQRCSVCPARKLYDKEMASVIEYDSGTITLCGPHEALLLQRLLVNYTKRFRKKKQHGNGPDFWIKKEKELEEEVRKQTCEL